MAAKNKVAKIVLLKEGTAASDFGQATVRRAQVVNAFEIMQTDYEPEPDIVQANEEGGFVVAELSEKEAGDMKRRPEVVDVVDDIEVFAIASDNDWTGQLDPDLLEADPDQPIDFTAFPFVETSEDEVPVSAEDLRLACQVEPDIHDEVDLAVLGAAPAGQAEEAPLRGGGDQLANLLKCLARCALQQGAGGTAPGEGDVISALRAAGLDDSAEAQATARDVILPNLRQIYANYAWSYSRGRGVRIAVVDTGVAPNHPDLRIYGGVSYVPGNSSWADDNGHGTHVAGTIAAPFNNRGVVGVAPDAQVYAVKVLKHNPATGRASGQLSWILNGLSWCYRNRMQVVNLSLGSRETSHSWSVYNRAYEHAGRRLRRRGILAVAAAGNSNEAVGNPARCPSYLAVSAIDSRYRRASFSCYGPQVEVCAPGVRIWSTYPPAGYQQLSGTSMACPHVAGVAALVKARHPAWPGDRIRVHLWRTALELGAPGRDWIYGHGQVRAYHAVR